MRLAVYSGIRSSPRKMQARLTIPWNVVGVYVAATIVVLMLNGCDQENTTPEKMASVNTEEGKIQPDQTPSQAIVDPDVDTNSVANTAVYESTSSFNEDELGIPIYEGAQPLDGGTWRLTDSLSEGAESMSSIRFLTSDPIDKVAGFYRERLQPNPEQAFEFAGPTGKTLSLTMESDLYAATNIILKERKDGTRIEINLMGRKPDIKAKITKEIITSK